MNSLHFLRPSSSSRLARGLRLAAATATLIATAAGCGIFDTTITLSPQEFKQNFGSASSAGG